MNTTYRRLLCRIARPLLKEFIDHLDLQARRYQEQADDLRGKPAQATREANFLGLASGYRAGAYLLRNTAAGMPAGRL